MEKNKEGDTGVPQGAQEASSKSATKLGTWIEAAINAGGVLTLRRKSWKYEAGMTWPNQDVESFEVDRGSIREAIERLESELREDAANEMVESGSV